MREEVKRIMKLVQEGKLSPEDAAELIEAFQTMPRDPGGAGAAAGEPAQAAATATVDEPQTPPTSGQPRSNDPFGGVIESIEKAAREISGSVDWKDVSRQIRDSARKSVEAVKAAVDTAQARGGIFLFSAGEEKTVELPLHVPDGKTLRIENAAGDIRIHGGHAAGHVIAAAHIRGTDADDARLKAESYTLVIEESDGFVLIRQPDVSGLTVDLDIRIAHGVPLDIKVESGDVDIHDTRAACRIRGASGDVRVAGAGGAVEIDLSSGDVWLSDSTVSHLTLENRNGDVQLDTVDGVMNLRTASGDVRLFKCSGKTVSIEAYSGDVDVDLSAPVEGSVNVRTVNGDVKLSVADGSDCRVALSTLRGSVSTALALADEAKSQTRITGRLGNGSGSVDVSAVNGDIRMEQRNHV